MRMELTKIHAIAVLQELKTKSEEVYKDMDDWLGARFQQEMQRWGSPYISIMLIIPETGYYNQISAIQKMTSGARFCDPDQKHVWASVIG